MSGPSRPEGTDGLVRPDLRILAGYHSPQLDVDVRLNTNESPLPPPTGFVDEVTKAVAAIEWNRYPDRAAWPLREAIGELHGVAAEQVFAANGSNEVLQSICLAFAGAGRTVATFEPTYAMHGQIARTTQARVVEGERGDDLRLDPDEVDSVVERERPDLVFVCSPNNPTGRAEERPLVEYVLSVAPGLVVVDEAYAQFSSWTALDLVRDDLPLVVTRTYSKTWALAAARLGYVIGPAALVAQLDKVALPYHLDAVTQAVGIAALRYRREMEERVSLLVEERGRVQAGLCELDVDTWPSDANFVLFRPRRRSGREVWDDLVARSVLVRDTSSWPRLQGCLRVTIGTRAENDRFLAALAEVLSR
jgi:histidinol-phosphate aminotransferase